MHNRIIDVINFIGKVKYIQEGEIITDAYEWMNENGTSTMVETIDVNRDLNGMATITIKRATY